MHAIIRLGKGAYYCSAVFGLYNDSSDQDVFSSYAIVLDQAKTCLVKQYLFEQRKRSTLHRRVLIFDHDQQDWDSFLSKNTALDYCASGELPEEIRKKCLEMDASVSLQDWYEIKTVKDIENVMELMCDFHDAKLEKLEKMENNALSIRFESQWACSLEVVFTGNVSYCAATRLSKDYDSYWSVASIFMKDGYTYLIDDDDLTAEDITDGYCWFKGLAMKYHIIPD